MIPFRWLTDKYRWLVSFKCFAYLLYPTATLKTPSFGRPLKQDPSDPPKGVFAETRGTRSKVAPLHIRLHHVISACHAAAHLAQRNPFWNYTSALNHNRQNLKLSSCRSEQKEIFDSFRFSLNVCRIACNNILARSMAAYIIHWISELPVNCSQCIPYPQARNSVYESHGLAVKEGSD